MFCVSLGNFIDTDTTVDSLEQLQALKQEWLYSHIDVPYPTSESVSGWSVYKDITLVPSNNHDGPTQELEWHWVSFHKLTVWFAQYYAGQLTDQDPIKNNLIEFFTQITIDPEDIIKLYVITSTTSGDIAAAGFCAVTSQGQAIIEHLGVVSLDTAMTLMPKF
jgi:hypothetical protein